MILEDVFEVAAPADVVWDVYRDVTRWPEWTYSVRSLAFVRGTAVEVGARARIAQPRLPVAVWEVTHVEPGRSWVWVSRSPLATTSARHVVEGLGGGRTRVAQRLEQRGLLGHPVGVLLAGLSRRYLALEARGLTARCEAAAGPLA